MLSFRACCFVLFYIIPVVSLYPQGSILERGQSGFAIGGGYSSNDEISGVGGGIGYSFNGLLDIGLSYDKFDFKEKLAGYDLTGTSFSPYIAYQVIKPDQPNKLAFSISASYETNSFDSEALDILNWEMEANALSFGGDLYLKMPINESTFIQPAAGITYISAKGTVKDSYGNSETDETTSTVYSAGIRLVFKTSSTMYIHFRPGVSINKDVTTIGFGAGIIFSTM